MKKIKKLKDGLKKKKHNIFLDNEEVGLLEEVKNIDGADNPVITKDNNII